MRALLVAGTGRMGREIGAAFLRRGIDVTWRSRDRGRLAPLQRWVARALRHEPGDSAAATARFLGPDDPLPAVDLAIETVDESAPAKRGVLSALEARLPAAVPLASNSSSLLPSSLHPRCQGLHFFQPTESARFVEWVVPAAAPDEVRARVRCLLDETGLRPIVQDEARAFALNRLLLPLQAACFRALAAGAPAALVDEASTSALLPVGQLAIFDGIGLDVVAPAVTNYVTRMPPDEAASLAPLGEGLALLLAAGKRGRKNDDGLLVGGPLPWTTHPEASVPSLRTDFEAILVRTCAGFLARGEIGGDDLRLAWTQLHGAEAAAALDRALAGAA